MVIGKPKDDIQMIGMDAKDFYFGAECLSSSRAGMLDLTRPVQKGIIPNDYCFEMLDKFLDEEIFKNVFGENAEDHKILITEPPNNPKHIRE